MNVACCRTTAVTDEPIFACALSIVSEKAHIFLPTSPQGYSPEKETIMHLKLSTSTKCAQRMWLLLLLLTALIGARTVQGQTTFGTITGEAKDQTGSVITSAAVTLTSEKTGFTYKATTSASESTSFPIFFLAAIPFASKSRGSNRL